MNAKPFNLATALADLAIGEPDFTKLVRQIEYEWSDGVPLKGSFFYPAFSGAMPDIDALVAFLDACLVDYCIPRSEIAAVYEQLNSVPATKAAKNILRERLASLKDRARATFIKVQKELKTGGEAGEVLLYILQERALKAPQLVSKMNLKTNANQPGFGRDGIHVTFNQDTKRIVLLMGESKLEKQFSTAIDHAIDSIFGYLNNLTVRDHEISVLRSHLDVSGLPEIAEQELVALLNPYVGSPPDAETVHVCLIGFEYSAFEKVAAMKESEIEAAFRAEYLERVKTGCILIKDKVKEKLPAGIRVLFFLFPFPSLASLRKTFLQKIGMNVDG